MKQEISSEVGIQTGGEVIRSAACLSTELNLARRRWNDLPQGECQAEAACLGLGYSFMGWSCYLPPPGKGYPS